MTTTRTIQRELIESDAQANAKRVLEGSDMTMDWRDAGYRSAREAADVLVGDGRDTATRRRTVAIVAAAIRIPRS